MPPRDKRSKEQSDSYTKPRSTSTHRRLGEGQEERTPSLRPLERNTLLTPESPASAFSAVLSHTVCGNMLVQPWKWTHQSVHPCLSVGGILGFTFKHAHSRSQGPSLPLCLELVGFLDLTGSPPLSLSLNESFPLTQLSRGCLTAEESKAQGLIKGLLFSHCAWG